MKQYLALCAFVFSSITPCRFLGYRFVNGNTVYTVFESGLLSVVQDQEEILVEERGNWSYN